MFDTLLTEVKGRDKQITVYRSDTETELENRFEQHGVSIGHEPLPAGNPEPFVVVEEDGEFAGAVALSELEAMTEPPVPRPGEGDGVARGYRVLFDALDDTVFATLERRQLLAVSREIEDRAYRVGTGTLRVSFQTLSTFGTQVDVYRHLAEDTDLDIHIYGASDWNPPEIEGITYHGVDTSTLERYWILGFDGGESENQASALVAREESDEYDGFWTDDPRLVEEILARLSEV